MTVCPIPSHTDTHCRCSALLPARWVDTYPTRYRPLTAGGTRETPDQLAARKKEGMRQAWDQDDAVMLLWLRWWLRHLGYCPSSVQLRAALNRPQRVRDSLLRLVAMDRIAVYRLGRSSSRLGYAARDFVPDPEPGPLLDFRDAERIMLKRIAHHHTKKRAPMVQVGVAPRLVTRKRSPDAQVDSVHPAPVLDFSDW